MQQDELARNEAWHEWWELVVGDDEPGEDTHDPHFNFMGGWDARGRYDEQRIAELDIPGPEECTCHAAYKDRGLVAPDCAYHAYEELFKALRALGQSEEVKP